MLKAGPDLFVGKQSKPKPRFWRGLEQTCPSQPPSARLALGTDTGQSEGGLTLKANDQPRRWGGSYESSREMRSHLSPELLVGLAGCCAEEAWASLQECEGSEETGAWAEDSGIGDLSEGLCSSHCPRAERLALAGQPSVDSERCGPPAYLLPSGTSPGERLVSTGQGWGGSG